MTDPRTGGQKGQKLARFDLIPPRPQWKLAEHYGKGAAKYPPRNWEMGYAWSLTIAALERHLNLWKQGEVLDEETGTHHLAAVVFHAFALMEFEETHRELDDRPDAVRRKAGTLDVGEPASGPEAGFGPGQEARPIQPPEGDPTNVEGIGRPCRECGHYLRSLKGIGYYCDKWVRGCPVVERANESGV